MGATAGGVLGTVALPHSPRLPGAVPAVAPRSLLHRNDEGIDVKEDVRIWLLTTLVAFSITLLPGLTLYIPDTTGVGGTASVDTVRMSAGTALLFLVVVYRGRTRFQR